jgi:hypothetical protein
VGTTAPDAVKRLVDLSACNAQADHFDLSRKVFLSGDYKEEQLRTEFLNGPCPTIRHSDFVVQASPGPFFTALGWDMDNALDTIRCRNRGSVPRSPIEWLETFDPDVCCAGFHYDK